MVQNKDYFENETGLRVEDAVVSVSDEETVQIVVKNYSGLTQSVEQGICIAES